MLKIEKQITITIDGDNVQTLSSICNCARIYMERNSPGGYNWLRGEKGIGEFTKEETIAIGKFISQVFERCDY